MLFYFASAVSISIYLIGCDRNVDAHYQLVMWDDRDFIEWKSQIDFLYVRLICRDWE